MNLGSCLNLCFASHCTCFSIPFHPQILSTLAPYFRKSIWPQRLVQFVDPRWGRGQILGSEHPGRRSSPSKVKENGTGAPDMEKMKPKSNLMCIFQFFSMYLLTLWNYNGFYQKGRFYILFLQLVLSLRKILLLACIDLSHPFSWLYSIPLCDVP